MENAAVWGVGIDACWNHWLCVPTGTHGHQTGVLSALGLVPLRRSTFDEADDIIGGVAHEHPPTTSLVFVTPEINGWTAVIGPWVNAFYGRRASATRASVERLSLLYGETHAFYHGSQGDGDGWMVARGGNVIRLCNYEDLCNVSIGAPLPIEVECLTRLGLTPPVEKLDKDSQSDFFFNCSAQTVATAISLNTVRHLPTNPTVRGHGVLAALPDDDTVTEWL